jgi:hypothetical protein
MELKGKALYNLLRISWLEDKSLKVEPWQVEDLREVKTEKLLSDLAHLGVVLDENSFPFYAESCESPEDLVEVLFVEDEDLEKQERAYLILFELWRRWLPEKLSLSIFCDELDALIEEHDAGNLENEEDLQKALLGLEDILDNAADQEGSSREVFEEVALYCAHDLEAFIFDIIAEQIEKKNEVYASELLDAFYNYVEDRKRFDFLRARLFVLSDIEEANIAVERLLGQLLEEPDLDLLFEIANSLIHRGDVRLFLSAVKQALPLVKKEMEFQSLLKMMADYYRCLDREEEEKKIQALLNSRSSFSLNHPIHPKDEGIAHIHFILRSSV